MTAPEPGWYPDPADPLLVRHNRNNDGWACEQ